MATPQVTTRILRRLLASGVHGRAERLLARMAPADIAPLLSGLTREEIASVIDLLFRQRRAARVLRELPPEMLPEIFDAVNDERLAGVLHRLEIDDLLEMVEWIPEERRSAVVGRLPDAARAELEKAELYPESSAGRVMQTSFVSLDEKMTSQEAIDTLRARADDDESILYLYVIDEQRSLRGVVPIRRLVSAPPARLIRDLMIPDPVSVQPDADQEQVAQIVARYDLLAVPVTDVDGRMLGVITVDDVIDVITEEATEDMYHLAGLSEDDRVFSPAHIAVRKRLPWMLVNLATAFLAAWVVGLFERTLEQVVALAIFMPVVAGMGGNGGIQSLTVITRGIALGEIEFSSGLRAALKELAVGLVMGALTGTVAAGLAYLTVGVPAIGTALFLAMVVTMAAAGLMGAAVPLFLKAVRLDPALGAGVIVTTFTDVFAFFSFLGIATLLLDHLTG
ncbi:MAG: magnesium transporter [Myxococcota bacterium]|jgi:magnesium transporter|nr:magnesium transporter [Deltaproteobacteria bacterium]MCP4239234.1 magnesium transporter [bacterium]MDP6075905.1 magnesium transporter [Myxococcota bacterium]MDP6242329.1 magnesium transporter [Myxococcota bacterium]MDP7076450.1 magnesium transporter [Myxococcota bacterium]